MILSADLICDSPLSKFWVNFQLHDISYTKNVNNKFKKLTHSLIENIIFLLTVFGMEKYKI